MTKLLLWTVREGWSELNSKISSKEVKIHNRSKWVFSFQTSKPATLAKSGIMVQTTQTVIESVRILVAGLSTAKFLDAIGGIQVSARLSVVTDVVHGFIQVVPDPLRISAGFHSC